MICVCACFRQSNYTTHSSIWYTFSAGRRKILWWWPSVPISKNIFTCRRCQRPLIRILNRNLFRFLFLSCLSEQSLRLVGRTSKLEKEYDESFWSLSRLCILRIRRVRQEWGVHIFFLASVVDCWMGLWVCAYLYRTCSHVLPLPILLGKDRFSVKVLRKSLIIFLWYFHLFIVSAIGTNPWHPVQPLGLARARFDFQTQDVTPYSNTCLLGRSLADSSAVCVWTIGTPRPEHQSLM